MKHAAIAALVAIMTIAGALSAVAATRTIETSTNLQLQFWLAPRSAPPSSAPARKARSGPPTTTS